MGANVFEKAIFLANQPFSVSTYLRAATDDLVSRFGSSESGETNLDLLKAETQKSFRGGMFQRVADDPEMASSITNAYYNKLDDRLYPTPDWQAISSAVDMGPEGVSSWCYFGGSLYVTWQKCNPGALNQNTLYQFDAGLNPTARTLPAALQSAAPLKLCAYGSNIFIAAMATSSDTVQAYRYNGVTTFTSVGGNFIDFFEFNDKLYGMERANGFYQVTAPTATPITFTKIGQIGPSGATTRRVYHDAVEFNGALYLGSENGLYRFDGVTVGPAIDYTQQADIDNFKYLAVFNGRLYYNVKNKLYQFDGTNIELIQDFGAAYRLNYFIGGSDRLWISATVDTGVPYSDKLVSGVSTYTHSVFCYDGVGFFEYKAFTEQLLIDYTQLVLIPLNGLVIAFVPDVYLNASFEPRSNGYNIRFLTLSDEFTLNRVNEGFEVISSEYDNGYPSIPKVLNGISASFNIVDHSEAVLSISIQYFINGVWSDWSEIWSSEQGFPDGTYGDYLLHDQGGYPTYLDTIPPAYERVRYRTTLSILSTPASILPSLSSVTLRYTLQPRLRLKWLLGLVLEGVDTRDLTTPTGSDGLLEDRKAATLRKIIYDCYRNKLPILLYDADFTTVKDDAPAGYDMCVHGTDFVVDGDTLAFQILSNPAGSWLNVRVSDVVYDEANNHTLFRFTLFGNRKGIGGANPASAIAEIGSQVRKSHAVYVKSIRNERYLLDDNTINNNSEDGNFSDIPSEITLDIVEI
jgi:hypothetical protein